MAPSRCCNKLALMGWSPAVAVAGRSPRLYSDAPSALSKDRLPGDDGPAYLELIIEENKVGGLA